MLGGGGVFSVMYSVILSQTGGTETYLITKSENNKFFGALSKSEIQKIKNAENQKSKIKIGRKKEI